METFDLVPVDLISSGFEFVNKLVDTIIAFYLTNPRTFFAILIGTIYVLHYLRNVTKVPLLFCADGRFRWFLKANCTTMNETYWPMIWCYETHLMTAISNFLRGLLPDLPYERELIRTPDGGQISLDWYNPKKGDARDDAPIALFMPGLTGNSQSEYIKTLVPMTYEIGYRPVVINYRGLGNTPLLTPRLYCAANCDDIRLAIEHIRRKNPRVKLIATGVSMGGILLGRYLITSGFESKIDAAFLNSVCWDLIFGATNMAKGLNYPLNNHLTKLMINIVEENREVFQNVQGVDLSLVRKAKNIREFDEAFTIKMFNFASVDQYYSESSHVGKLACIKTPTLCINAADDMFAPLERLPIQEVAQSSHVAMLVTERGGHIGFMEGLLPSFRPSYYSERLAEQYFRALYQMADIRRELL